MPAEVIRKQGLCSALIAYVDDFIGADGGTVEDTHPRATAAVGVLSDFGFLMNQDKQNLNMETRFTALGFLLNTDDMVVELTEKRVTKFLETAGEVRAHHQKVTARDLANARGPYPRLPALPRTRVQTPNPLPHPLPDPGVVCLELLTPSGHPRPYPRRARLLD